MKIKDQKILDEKKKILENARIELKKKFFGIDEIVDEFITTVESWFITPELRTRPLIVNLWGITGVGKTDFVRTFINLIKFQNKYFELDSGSTEVYRLQESLYENGFFNNEESILFVDEFQKLRTVNEKDEEKDVSGNNLSDLWGLLSDGEFPIEPNRKRTLQTLIENIEADYKKSTDIVSQYVKGRIFEYMYFSQYTNIEHFKNTRITKKDAITILKKILERDKFYEDKRYTKLLIIISGNLDEAFTFSRSSSADADLDADLYNAMAKKIKITDIKSALLKRFRPEQIARLGNIHLIYPVLSKEAYNKIIDKYILDFTKKSENEFGVKLTIDDKIKKAIYKNGVYPIQGVRPLLATMSVFVDNPVSSIISKISLMGNKIVKSVDEINLSYEKIDGIGYVVSNVKGVDIDNIKCEVNDALDKIRSEKKDDELTMHSVHEAGHAVMQAILYNVPPIQITSTTSSSSSGGFCTIYENSGSRDQMFNDIMVSFAGRAAEEIVFGQDKVSFGASEDIKEATSDLMHIVMIYGMDRNKARHSEYDLDVSIEDTTKCEDLAKQLYADTVRQLSDNKKFLCDVADELIKESSITSFRFSEIAKENGFNLKEAKIGDKIEESYSDMFNKFKKTI